MIFIAMMMMMIKIMPIMLMKIIIISFVQPLFPRRSVPSEHLDNQLHEKNDDIRDGVHKKALLVVFYY